MLDLITAIYRDVSQLDFWCFDSWRAALPSGLSALSESSPGVRGYICDSWLVPQQRSKTVDHMLEIPWDPA